MTPAPEAHLAGSPVVITGVGARGQAGESVARAFAQAGAIVHCVGRGSDVRDRVDELQRDQLAAHAHIADLADFDATSRVATSIAAAHDGRIRMVVALAGGFGASGHIAGSDPNVFAKQMSINLITAYSTARAFATHVRAARGVMVFVGSASVLPGGKTADLSAYAMAKGGVLQLVRTLAEEERDIRVYGVAPTAIRTAANEASMGTGVRYIEREDFAATIIAMSRPSFALASGEVMKLA